MKIIIWFMFMREIFRAFKRLKEIFTDKKLESRIAAFIAMCVNVSIIYFLYLFIVLSKGI